MSKSKRLLDLMMTVNRKRRFKVQELADEFGVSKRTILRDLQELSELGVPLYSEVGPHGGYQVLNERILPPIAFTEEEAVAIFFACHALRHYTFLPFKTESSSALSKFYHYMSGDVRDRIDQMKHRVDFITPKRQAEFPYLSILLEAAMEQKIILIEYESRQGTASRKIQPVGLYASSGLWYCSAYCFLRGGFRVFRCDRIHTAVEDVSDTKPLDLRHIHLDTKEAFTREHTPEVRLQVELTPEGVQQCEAELWSASRLHVREDGTGWIKGEVPERELPFFAKFFIGLGKEADVRQPPELLDRMRQLLTEMMERYAAK